jgi:hypothetical protein
MSRVHEEVKIAFYDVTKCGYYSYSKTNPYSFFNLEEVLSELARWVHQPKMTLGKTLTFQVAEDSEELPVYCYDIVKHSNGDFLLVTWNATPALDNQVAAVKGTGPVGSAQVVTKGFDREDIPGYATYFWFMPSQNCFATIRFRHLVNGQEGMKRFILGYLQNFSGCVYKEANPSGGFDTSYRRDAEDRGSHYPSFSTARKRLPGEIEMIKTNRPNITKVVNNSKIDPMLKADQKAIFQGILALMGIKSPSVQRQDVDIKNEIRMTPAQDELDAIIENWEASQSNGSFDVGFCFRGDSGQVHWLSKSIAKASIQLIIERQDGNNEIILPEKLLDALAAKKDVIRRMAIHE